MCANSNSSGETARMRRLAWAFAGKYHNLMSWLKFLILTNYIIILFFFVLGFIAIRDCSTHCEPSWSSRYTESGRSRDLTCKLSGVRIEQLQPLDYKMFSLFQFCHTTGKRSLKDYFLGKRQAAFSVCDSCCDTELCQASLCSDKGIT